MSDRTELLAKIEAAARVISEAEKELSGVVGDSAVSPSNEEVELREVVRAASVRLHAAETELEELERLQALAKIDDATERVDRAKTAIADAEKDLENVLSQMEGPAPLAEAWVTEVVEAAFTKLRAAKKGLVDLEKSIAADDD